MKIYNGKIDETDLEHVIRIRKEMPIAALPCPYKKGIHPNTSRFLFKDGTITDVFHVKPIYYLHVDGTFRPLSEVTYGFGNHWAILKEDWFLKIHPRFVQWWNKRMELINGKITVGYKMPTWVSPVCAVNTISTFFPDPDPETTTVDGFARRGISIDESFTSIRGGLGDGARDAEANDEAAIIGSSGTTNQYRSLARAFYLFDTSAIPDGDPITDAIFSVKNCSAGCTTASSFGGNGDLVASTIASNTAIANSDYQGTVNNNTRYATGIALSGWSTAYNDFAMNQTGRDAISKTGVTKLGMKVSWDLDNSAPTWSSLVWDSAGASFADTAGTASDPKLVVTHGAVGGANLMGLLGIG